jgi:hypothetical protein
LTPQEHVADHGLEPVLPVEAGGDAVGQQVVAEFGRLADEFVGGLVQVLDPLDHVGAIAFGGLGDPPVAVADPILVGRMGRVVDEVAGPERLGVGVDAAGEHRAAGGVEDGADSVRGHPVPFVAQ